MAPSDQSICIMLRLSFIVPVYGVEQYIKECIRSLYAQDIPQEEYEVICVDDCSPDGSREIVERLQKEYPTLRLLVHTENKRQGGARNTAMQIAKGQYIWFVDSDDYIKTNCLKGLLEQAEKEDLDILDFDFATESEKQTFTKNLDSYNLGPCAGADYVFNNHRGKWSWRCSSICGGLIKRSLIDDICFREKVQYEDNDFALMMYAKAKRVHHISERPYYYRVVDDSTVHKVVTLTQVDYNIQLLCAYVEMYDKMNALDERWGIGMEELMRYVGNQVIDTLKKVTGAEVKEFFQSHEGRINGLRKYIGKRLWLALNYRWVFKFYK